MNKQDCGILIKQIHTTLEKKANNALKSSGMTVAQMTVLMTLYRAPDGQMPMKELEKTLCVAQSTIAGLAARLERKEFIIYLDDEDDKRIKFLKITAAGIQCCKQAELMMAKTEDMLLAPLTEAERAVFRMLLEKIRNALE